MIRRSALSPAVTLLLRGFTASMTSACPPGSRALAVNLPPASALGRPALVAGKMHMQSARGAFRRQLQLVLDVRRMDAAAAKITGSARAAACPGAQGFLIGQPLRAVAGNCGLAVREHNASLFMCLRTST